MSEKKKGLDKFFDIIKGSTTERWGRRERLKKQREKLQERERRELEEYFSGRSEDDE